MEIYCIYASQELGGYRLKEIGTYYDMKDSAVSQSNRRFKQNISKDEQLEQILADIQKAIGFVES